jgi:hypothetical protein
MQIKLDKQNEQGLKKLIVRTRRSVTAEGNVGIEKHLKEQVKPKQNKEPK